MRAIFCMLIVLALPAAAAAQRHSGDEYLGFYSGYFDISQDDNAAAQFGVEYRSADLFYGLRPGIGFNATTDNALYAYGGFFWDIHLSDQFVFTPNIVAGGFTQGDGKDLGHALEFRSGLELSYQFETGERLGLAFNHISNASIGDDNPGAETLLVIYQHPLNLFTRAQAQPRRATLSAPSDQPRWWR